MHFGDAENSAASNAMDGALGRNNDIETQGGLGDADTAMELVVLLTSLICHQTCQASKLVFQKT